ncbi:HEXXH motif domain-containing protein [Amycolatopsis anabasis]|uniref:HEXXH motif domain-containing protein n=1 Tax=Amycolatopsis anabasis TaxID=1840409 RepID=UPI00131D35F4|nr:HEXXH motif domain-containing protein [Amycolatopsis anabasis]
MTRQEPGTGPPNGLDRHTLPSEVFHALCAGPVPPESLAVLRSAEYSRRKLLLRTLLDLLADAPDAAGPLTGPEDAWRVLALADRRAPEIAEDVLMYPTVGVWAARVVARLIGAETSPTPLWTEIGYLHSLAAAAAIRANVPCAVRVPVLYGAINLPTLGQLRVPTDFPVGTAELAHGADGVRLRAGSVSLAFPLSGETFLFRPTRSHTSTWRGLALRVRVDDTDPYREYSSALPPARLGGSEFAEWGKLLDEAWRILTERHSAYAAEIAACLNTLVPTDPAGGLVAASASSAFGAVLLSPKASAPHLAETLVHEIQHAKLNALLGLVVLVKGARDPVCYAPWLDEPRPSTGLLHGVYAFTSVVEFYRTQRAQADQAEARAAQFLFAYRRAQVREALAELARAPGLTELGRSFVAVAGDRIARCAADPVDADLLDVVTEVTADHRAGWLLRHRRPDDRAIHELASAWLRGHPAPRLPEFAVTPNQRRVHHAARATLLETNAVAPTEFAQLASREHTRLPRGDLAYAQGDHTAAAAAYTERIAADPADGQAWIGLGLCLRARGEAVPARALLELPDVTVAVHERLRGLTAAEVDPIPLARWLGERLQVVSRPAG